MANALNRPSCRLAHRRGAYGFDEPVWPVLFSLLGVLFVALGIVSFGGADNRVWGIIWGSVSCACALFFFLSAASYLYTTRQGKFQVWADILPRLNLRGDEQILDMGCGRGAVLLMVAHLLPRGKATGVDLWKTHEQSGNALTVTQRNAQREGVADCVALQTADMRRLPFPDGAFDVVVTSLAIHNIRDPKGRQQALGEAARVLKPGGRLVIADFFTQRYGERLREVGMIGITRRGLGWRFWYGGPWFAVSLVSARKLS